jgi:hypothetical protein
LRVEEFQKQWESLETPCQLPHKLFGILAHQFADGLPFEWVIVVHRAGMVVAVAEHPGIADRTTRQRRAQ